MPRFFADTFYWVALLSRHDTWHERVTAFNRTLRRDDKLLTTDAILLELLAAFSGTGPHMRQQAVIRVEAMFSNPFIHVIEVTRALFLEGLAFYKSRPDKAYSLTDCLSMQVMHREGLHEVLTHDHHFTQEGFRILFP
jgi:predicted nucleic acid-binding protein